MSKDAGYRGRRVKRNHIKPNIPLNIKVGSIPPNGLKIEEQMPTTLHNIVAPSLFFYSVTFGRYMRLKVKVAIQPNGLKIVEGVSMTL